MSAEILEVRVVGVDQIQSLDDSLAELARRFDKSRSESKDLEGEIDDLGKRMNYAAVQARDLMRSIAGIESSTMRALTANATAADQAMTGAQRAIRATTAAAKSLGTTASDVNKGSAALDKYEDQAKAADRQVDRLARSVDAMALEAKAARTTLVGLGGGLGGLSSGLAGVGGAAGEAGEGLGLAGAAAAASVEDIIGNMMSGLSGGTAALTGFTVAGGAAIASLAGAAILGASSVNQFTTATTRGERAVAPFWQAFGDLQIAFGEAIVSSSTFQASMEGMIGIMNSLGPYLVTTVEIFDNLADVFGVVAIPGKALYSLVLSPIVDILGVMAESTRIAVEWISDLANVVTDWAAGGVNVLVDKWNDWADSVEKSGYGITGLIPRMDRMERTIEGLNDSINPARLAFQTLGGVMARVRAEVEQSNLAMQTYTANWVRANSEIINITQTQSRARQMMISLDQALGGFFSQPDEIPPRPAQAMDSIREAAERALAKIKELNEALVEQMSRRSEKTSAADRANKVLSPGEAYIAAKREEAARLLGQIEAINQSIKDDIANGEWGMDLEGGSRNKAEGFLSSSMGFLLEGYDPKTDPKFQSELRRIHATAAEELARANNEASAAERLRAARAAAQGEGVGPDWNTMFNMPSRVSQLPRGMDDMVLWNRERSEEFVRNNGMEEYTRLFEEQMQVRLQMNQELASLGDFGFTESPKERTVRERSFLDSLGPKKFQENFSEKAGLQEAVDAQRQLIADLSMEEVGVDLSVWSRSAEQVQQLTEAYKDLSKTSKDALKFVGQGFGGFGRSAKAGLEAALSTTENFAEAFHKAMGSTLISEGFALGWKGLATTLGGNPGLGALQFAGGAAMVIAGRGMGGTSGGGPEPSSAAASIQQGENTQISVLNNFGFVGDRRRAAADVASAVRSARLRRA